MPSFHFIFSDIHSVIMIVPFLFSTLLLSLFHGSFAVECPRSSDQWCSTTKIAEACGVRFFRFDFFFLFTNPNIDRFRFSFRWLNNVNVSFGMPTSMVPMIKSISLCIMKLYVQIVDNSLKHKSGVPFNPLAILWICLLFRMEMHVKFIDLKQNCINFIANMVRMNVMAIWFM